MKNKNNIKGRGWVNAGYKPLDRDPEASTTAATGTQTRYGTPLADWQQSMEPWQYRLRALAAKHGGAAVECDIDSLSQDERWGVYRFLSRVAAEGARE